MIRLTFPSVQSAVVQGRTQRVEFLTDIARHLGASIGRLELLQCTARA